MQSGRRSNSEKAADIIRSAGGRLVGRTRLQKVAYLLEITGAGSGFVFEYRHYGPFSEDLANATSSAKLSGLIHETEHPTAWGGWYSVFEADKNRSEEGEPRKSFILAATAANPVELELAATAAFLALEGETDPWQETARRKPDKSSSIDAAKHLYASLEKFSMPHRLPTIDSSL